MHISSVGYISSVVYFSFGADAGARDAHRMTGINSPGTIDLVTENEEVVRLVLIEERALSDDDAVALQEKLNNYLAYALEGTLQDDFPQVQSKRVCLPIDLYAQPSAFIRQFVSSYRDAIAERGVMVELSINGALAE